MIFWISLPIIGILVGFLSGLLGIGGGVVSVPVLIMLFPLLNIQPNIALPLALGSSLAISALTLGASLYQHYKNQNIDFPTFYKFFPGIIVGAMMGPYIVHMLPVFILKNILSILFFLLALNAFFDYYHPTGERLPNILIMLLSGCLIGSLATFVGTAGAIFIIPYLAWFGMPLHKAVGVAAICGVPLAFIGMCSYMLVGHNVENLPYGAVGYVYWPAVLALAVTSTPVALMAAKISRKIPHIIIRKLLGILFLMVSVKMIFSY